MRMPDGLILRPKRCCAEECPNVMMPADTIPALAVLDGFEDGFLLLDSDSRVIWANRAARQRFSITLESDDHPHCAAICAWTQCPEHGPVAKTLATGQPHRGRVTVPTAAEGEQSREVSAYPQFTEGAGTCGVLVQVHETAPALCSKEAEPSAATEALLGAVCDGLVSLAPDSGLLVDCNPGFLALFGHGKSGLPANLHIDDLCAEADPSQSLLDALTQVSQGTASVLQRKMGRADGTEFWAEWSARQVEIGGAHRLAAGIRDISRRKAAEAELTRIREALDDCGSAVVMLDRQGRATYINAAFGLLFGYTNDTAEELRIQEVFLDRDEAMEVFATVLAGGQWEGELSMRARRGTTFPALLRITPVLDDEFEIAGVLCILNDITERKQLEAQLIQAQNLKSVGQLAAGIAHEINTPTQYVSDNTRFFKDCCDDLFQLIDHYEALEEGIHNQSGLAEALAAVESCRAEIDLDYLRDDMPRAIEQTLEGVGRVSQIVGAMRQFTHGGGDEKRLIDLNKAIEATATVARSEWKYVAELETMLDPAMPLVPCLPGAINQVLLNLIVNASHAIAGVVGDGTGAKGKITLVSRVVNDYAEIRVRDTGTGIPESARDRVFEPFFTTKDVGKGTGQGLAISHAVVVDKHGGSLTFETETGAGSTFIVRLPLSSGGDTAP